MQPVTRLALLPALATAALAAAATGCLDPLVKDDHRVSTHLLPPGTAVPLASDNLELKNQIMANDGLDDRALAASGNLIPLGTGQSAGGTVRFWSFGASTTAPSPLYKLYRHDASAPGGRTAVDHRPLVDALPGDPAYSGVHALVAIYVTDKYQGELITTAAALEDAIELGLIEDPAPLGQFVASPIVLLDTPATPGPLLQLADTPPGGAPVVARPTEVYGRGYVAGLFEIGGPAGVQPGAFILPTMQVSFLRGPTDPAYNAANPIFQATVQTAPPASGRALYSPLSVVLDVDLKDTAADIHGDGDLFVRDAGAISKVNDTRVALFQVTPAVLLLPLQFPGAMP